jgi:hypothetical protein
MGKKGIGIMYGKEKCFTGPKRAAKERQHLLYRHDTKGPNKEGPFSFLLLESPLASFSKVSRGHPSLVSLVETPHSRTISRSLSLYFFQN